jgi:hypothetical protein
VKYIREYKDYNSGKILIIVDVQKSFRKYFSEMYINELKKHCNGFEQVYQVWDNHVTKNKSKDYLFKDEPEIPIIDELYTFPNQKDLIEKRYNYDVDSNFYKKILDKETFNIISKKEKEGTIKKGDFFKTKNGTIIVYIGNKHKWFHCPKKLYNLFKKLIGKKIEIVGGSDSECLDDVFTTCESLSLNVDRNYKYIWSANHCPIK